jgi:hypothetical protein
METLTFEILAVYVGIWYMSVVSFIFSKDTAEMYPGKNNQVVPDCYNKSIAT